MDTWTLVEITCKVWEENTICFLIHLMVDLPRDEVGASPVPAICLWFQVVIQRFLTKPPH